MRNTKVVTVSADGRDRGKSYLLTEMSAFRAEKWGMRAMLALENSGFRVPDELKGSGMAGIAALGGQQVLNGRLDFAEFEPLLDDMMTCVQFLPNPSNLLSVRPIREVADDIEEVSTLFELRKEVLLLHLGFLPAGLQSMVKTFLTEPASSPPQTSPSPSPQPSAPASQ